MICYYYPEEIDTMKDKEEYIKIKKLKCLKNIILFIKIIKY